MISPIHVRIPFARPCNPFTVNSNQHGRQRKWIYTLGLNSVTVKKHFLKPFWCQTNGCYLSSIDATNIRGKGGLGVRTTRCPTPLFSNAPRAWNRLRPGLLYFSHSIRSVSAIVFFTLLADLTILSAAFDAMITCPQSARFKRSANFFRSSRPRSA